LRSLKRSARRPAGETEQQFGEGPINSLCADCHNSDQARLERGAKRFVDAMRTAGLSGASIFYAHLGGIRKEPHPTAKSQIHFRISTRPDKFVSDEDGPLEMQLLFIRRGSLIG